MPRQSRAKADATEEPATPIRPEPEGLGTIINLSDMDARTLVGDVRDFILQEARDAKSGLPWTQRQESDQRDIIDRADGFAREMVRRVVDIVASEAYPSFQCLPDGWTVKDGLKITLKASATASNIHAMTSASETSLFLVFAPTASFGSARAAVRAVPDQGSLAYGKDEDDAPAFDQTDAGARQAVEA